MDKLKKLIALTAAMALFVGQVQAQGQECCDDSSAAYADCGSASYWSAALPIGAIAVAAIIIATTNNRHHHHHSSSSNSSHSSHSHSHAHFSNSNNNGCF
jgi:hypothetical protein